MRLLTLPDELLDTVVDELQFVHAEADGRDLLSYRRRDTNRKKKDVERLGLTCKRLREITLPHLKRHPETGMKRAICNNISALQLHGEALCLLPEAPLGRLVDLTLSRDRSMTDDDYEELFPYDPDLPDQLLPCVTLQTLVVSHVALEAGTDMLLARAAALPKLQHLTLVGVVELAYVSLDRLGLPGGGGYMPHTSFQDALTVSWRAPLTRLEFCTCDIVSLCWFVALLEHIAPTLQVAIVRSEVDRLMGSDGHEPEPSLTHPDFPALWRLTFSSSLDPSSCGGAFHNSGLSTLLSVWSKAPKLVYLECSPAFQVSSSEQLKQIADLRPQLEYARLELTIGKARERVGVGWTDEEKQVIRIG